jgi:hypothetical protein
MTWKSNLKSNLNNKSTDLTFLPGVFNPTSGIKGIFTPGIMALPIDNFNLNTLRHESSKYLNKFAQIILPFNLNVLVTPYRSFLYDALSSSSVTVSSKLLLTPLDFHFNSSFDFIRKDIYFMSNLFSPESFAHLAQSQPPIDRLGLLSTQLFISDKDEVSSSSPMKKRINNKNGGISQIKGIQFYNQIQPTNNNVTILPLIAYAYDERETIPANVIQTAIVSFCSNYRVEMNEFHLRICDAQQKEISLEALFAQNQCKECSLLDFLVDYYSNRSSITKKSDSNLTLIIVLATVLSKVYFFLLKTSNQTIKIIII